MSHFLGPCSHPLSGSAESEQLVFHQHVSPAMYQGAFCLQGAADGTQQLLLTRKEKQQSLSLHTAVLCFIHCAPCATLPCFLRPT